MSEPITEEERAELIRRMQKLHTLYNLGGAYEVEPYVIDYVQNIGVWVYDHSLPEATQVFAANFSNSHADHSDPDEVREVLETLRKRMVLEDLADV